MCEISPQTTSDGEQYDSVRPLLNVQTVGVAAETGARHHGGVLDTSKSHRNKLKKKTR